MCVCVCVCIIYFIHREHKIPLLKKESNMTLFILGKTTIALCWFGKGLYKKNIY